MPRGSGQAWGRSQRLPSACSILRCSLPHLHRSLSAAPPAVCTSSRAVPALSPQRSVPPLAPSLHSPFASSFRASINIHNNPKVLDPDFPLWFLSCPLPGNPPSGPAHQTLPPASLPLPISDRTRHLPPGVVFPLAFLLQRGALWSRQ